MSIWPCFTKDSAGREIQPYPALNFFYNIQHNITPKTIVKPIVNTLEITKKIKTTKVNAKDIPAQIEKMTALMNKCAKDLDFERAILLREQIQELRDLLRKGEKL